MAFFQHTVLLPKTRSTGVRRSAYPGPSAKHVIPSAARDPSSMYASALAFRRNSPQTKKRPRHGIGAAPISILSVRGLGLLRWRHADKPSPVPPVGKLHVALDQCEQGVVLALRHILAGLMPGPALPDQNRSAVHQFAAESLYA